MENILKRAADKLGWHRVKYNDNNVPTQTSNIKVLLFFGDYRSIQLLSSFFKEKEKGDYIVLCSWPGANFLFPKVDETWTLPDQQIDLLLQSLNETEDSDLYNLLLRKLNEWFENVISFKVIDKPEISNLVFYPEVPSFSILPSSIRNQFDIKNGKKVLIHPIKYFNSWQNNQIYKLLVPYDFWIVLSNLLIEHGYVPVVYENTLSYDLSNDFLDKCIFVKSNDISHLFSLTKFVDCTIDLYSGISRFAILSKSPFIAVDERERYFMQQDVKIDYLCSKSPYKNIFSFASMITTSNESIDWRTSIIDCLIKRLNYFLIELDDFTPMPDSFLEEKIEFDNILLYYRKKYGTYFISSSKNKNK